MSINQVKKLRKIVRIKKLATKNNKIFVCTMKKTLVHYKMVLTIIPCVGVKTGGARVGGPELCV